MKNIVENNTLLAEFLGHSLFDGINYYEPRNMKFHNDWNYLMQVVEKIHSMQSYGVLINPNGTYIQDEDDKVICMTFKNEEVNGEIISSSNIEATFNCCAEFVKWYNEQNK